MKNKLQKRALSTAILTAIGSAHGATIYVDGNCTLIEAMQTANSDMPIGACEVGNGADVIRVVTENQSMTINTIFESSMTAPGNVGLPIINSEVTIEGNGLVLSADHQNYNFRMLQVEEFGDLTLKDTTISRADDSFGFGSGLLVNQGRVTLENTTFNLNNSALFIVGSYGSIINNSVIRHNVANHGNAETSAGVSVINSQVEINHSSIVNNRYQISIGLANTNGSNTPQAILGGGAPKLSGGLTLIQSEVSISDSTISKNQSIYGGGINISEGSPIVNSSAFPAFISNRPQGIGSSTTTIKNSTITQNKSYIAAGILNISTLGTLTLQGNIIAGNKETYGPFSPNIYNAGGTMYLDAHNIIGDRGYSGAYGVTLGASDSSFVNNAEDNLYPLTLTNDQLVHPLKIGSSAIDANDLSCYGSIFDQEGKGRGKDGNNDGDFVCDVGAFEHTAPIMANDAPCTLQNAILSANNDASIGGCQPGNGHDIIILPENSTQSADSIAATPFNFYFGFNAIDSGITIEGMGSTFERADSAVDNFDLLVVNPDAQLNLVNSTVTGANGTIGAVTTLFGNVNLINSTITQNQVTGLFDYLSINSSVVGSTISQNQYTLSFTSANFAAGVSSLLSTGFELRNSTISQNTGYFTGGVDIRDSTMQLLENSTVSGNFALGYGGVLTYNRTAFGSLVNGLTITNNEGTNVGGLTMIDYNPIPTGALIRNSIISGNILTPPPPSASGSFQNNGLAPNLAGRVTQGVIEPRELNLLAYNTNLNFNNIIGSNGDSGAVGASLGSSDQIPAGPTSAVIDTNLADNGGQTLTHSLVSGSIGIDSGQTNCGLRSDQVGNMRPWDGDGNNDERCDAGAVEYNSIPVNDIIFKDGFDATIILRSAPTKQ
ncbi:MAG: choice-of-anchor Q domain-containing protein [Marinicella sp.]